MGKACSKLSGAGSAAKDKDDKYMEEIEYKKLKVDAVDAVLEPAFDVLGTAVSVNNALWQTVDTVKTVGSTLLGAFEPEIAIDGTAVKFIVVKEDDEGKKTPVAEVIGGTGAETTEIKSEDDFKKIVEKPKADAAIKACSAQLESLNAALKEAMVGVEAANGNRLKATMTGEVASDDAAALKAKTTAITAVKSFNNTYFTVKNQLILMEMENGLKQALSELVANLKKLVGDIKPKLDVDFAGLKDGELSVTPDLGITPSKLAATCPKKVKKCLDALFGEKFLTTGDPLSPGGLLATLKETAAQCAEILTKFQEISQGVQELGSDPAKLVEQAGEAGLSGIEKLAFPKKVAANIKTAMKTPLILAGLVTTIKDITMEIKEGLTASADNMMDAKI